ncbi:Ferredoxin-1 [bioreactor metagenome]|uniref:Ferredoxin-1 n=1 Tax=bioreactor metagenome TaxID=1076179 RepID=A0A644TNQ6_9ZZZZ|nr:4Fe-4S binding protein [Negativicutes bacterium]
MFIVTVDAEACSGCGECVKACPGQILALQDCKAQLVGDECLGCLSCETVCPATAIKVEEY